MSFDFSSLVTDRTQSDVNLLNNKGTYNAADMNRVTAAMDTLYGFLTGLGYAVPGYAPVYISRPPIPAPSRLPDGYTELEFIRSSGTQYIDTEFKPSNTTRVVCDVENFYSGTASLFGCRVGLGNVDYSIFIASGTSIRSSYGSNYQSIDFDTLSRFLIDKNMGSCSIGGEVITQTSGAFQSGLNMLIFGLNNNGSSGGSARAAVYQFDVYDNGQMVRNFVPCKNPSGDVGMYDLVTAAFYGNAGSGIFVAGPEIPPAEEPDTRAPYTWFVDDVPTAGQLAQYLANAQALRDAIASAQFSADLPQSMAVLTYVGANAIEQILVEINAYLTAMQAVFLRSGMTWAVAGGPGFYFAN